MPPKPSSWPSKPSRRSTARAEPLNSPVVVSALASGLQSAGGMRFETRTSRLLLTLATLVTSRVAHPAQDARPVAPPAWDLASVREIEGGHQIGVLAVGTADETNA